MNAVDTNVYVYSLDADETVKQAKALELFDQLLLTETVFQISFQLRSRFSLSHWDAMLLAACKEAGVTTLYSEDLDAGTNYDGLSVVNPFA